MSRKPIRNLQLKRTTKTALKASTMQLQNGAGKQIPTAHAGGLARRSRTTASDENGSSTASLRSLWLQLAGSVQAAVSKPIKARPLSLTEAARSIPPLQGGERAWPKVLASYREPHRGCRLIEVLVTLVPFVVFWLFAAMAVDHGFWSGLAVSVPAAGFLLRLVMIWHDCGFVVFAAQ